MSGVHVHLLIDQEHEFEVSVQPSQGRGLARVDVIGVGRTWVGIQSSDAQALRGLAGALLDAAAKSEDLTRRLQDADDERVALNAEAEAEPGYDPDPAEVSP